MKISRMNIHSCLLSFCPSFYTTPFPLHFIFPASLRQAFRLITLYFLLLFLIIGSHIPKFCFCPNGYPNSTNTRGWGKRKTKRKKTEMLHNTERNNLHTGHLHVLQSKQAGNINNQGAHWINKYVFVEYVVSGIPYKRVIIRLLQFIQAKVLKINERFFIREVPC